MNEWMNEWMKSLFSLVVQLLLMRTYCTFIGLQERDEMSYHSVTLEYQCKILMLKFRGFACKVVWWI